MTFCFLHENLYTISLLCMPQWQKLVIAGIFHFIFIPEWMTKFIY